MNTYHQIPIERSDIAKTIFTRLFGLFDFADKPYGLRKAAQASQRFMDDCYARIPVHFFYHVDILLGNRTGAGYKVCLRILFEQMDELGLVLKHKK